MSSVKEFYFSDEHEWVHVVDGIAYIGISDYAQNAMGEIVYVDMPSEGDEFSAADEFGAVESVKSASDLYMPVSGVILEVNEDLDDSPSLINENPYDTWIVKVKMSDENELDELMDHDAYHEYLETL